jgi:hypothetical protein
VKFSAVGSASGIVNSSLTLRPSARFYPNRTWWGRKIQRMPLRDTTVIHTRRATWFIREERPDGDPFMVREFIA